MDPPTRRQADDVHDDERTADDKSARLLISVLAVAIAAVHVAAPRVKIDTTTLILLALAALPWLAPFLQSITLPGGFGVVLRDIHDRVERVETKVVESGRQVQELAAKLDLLVGGDPISSEKRDEIAAHIAGLGAYLQACGLPLPSTNPTINIDAKTPLPYYLPGDDPQLVIPPDASAEMIQGFYALHVLDATHPESEDVTRRSVGRGLAYYFACSYAEAPPPTVEPFDSLKFDDARAGTDNPAAAVLLAGASWAQFAWTLRDILPPRDLDRALATAWIATKDRKAAFERAFSAKLVEVVRKIGDGRHVDAIAGALRAREMIS